MGRLEREEIQNLETAIMCAIKQTSMLMIMALATPDSPISVKDILNTTLVYNDALTTIEKLKKGEV